MKRSEESYADVEQLISTGLDHYLQGRLQEAAAAFHEALWLDPSNEQAQVYLKATLSTSGMPEPQEALAPESPPETAWDFGTSLQESEIVVDSGVEPAPLLQHVAAQSAIPPRPASNARSQIDALLNEARAFEARGDFTSALDRCEKLLALDPTHADTLKLQDTCTRTLLQMYESRIGPPDGVPEVVTRPDEMIWLNLDHRAGFVLAQIDGTVSYDDLYAVCGMSQLDTARLLSELLAQGIIRTRPRTTGRHRSR